jgi:phosphoglycolate phosphatase-like HAD superfamily hydrolase
MRVCLFDIDGTLISSGGAGKAAMEAALTSEFGVRSITDRVPYSGRTDRAIVRDLFLHYGISEERVSWQRFRDAYLSHLPECMARQQGRVLPGIADLLRQLQAKKDFVLGLLTGNLRAGARIKLAHFDLFHFFALGGFGDYHLERDDVAREAWAEVQRHLGGKGDPNRLWVVGDTPLDVRCARAIGARVAAVCTGWHCRDDLAACEPDVLVADLSDPAPFLSALAS